MDIENRSKLMYNMSFDAMVIGFLMKPTLDNTDEVKFATRCTGNILLDTALDMKDENQKISLLMIVNIISQMVGVDKLEQKSSEILSRCLEDKDKDVLSILNCTNVKADDPSYMDFIMQLAMISGVKSFEKAFLELDELEFSVNI